MRWNRTEYIDLMTFNHPERPMFSELFGLLIGLDEEWKRDGATPEELDLTGFCFDYVSKMFVGTMGPIHTFQETVIAEDEESYVGRDYLGRTVRMCKNTATIPLPMDYPVKDMDSWLKIKPMFMFEESRVDEDQIQKAIAAQREGTLILCEIPGGFDMTRELMGEENLCIAYYEDPELIEDIIGTLQDTAFQVLDRISSASSSTICLSMRIWPASQDRWWAPILYENLLRPITGLCGISCILEVANCFPRIATATWSRLWMPLSKPASTYSIPVNRHRGWILCRSGRNMERPLPLKGDWISMYFGAARRRSGENWSTRCSRGCGKAWYLRWIIGFPMGLPWTIIGITSGRPVRSWVWNPLR